MPGSQRGIISCREEATGPQSRYGVEKELRLSRNVHLWVKTCSKGKGRVWRLQKRRSREED